MQNPRSEVNKLARNDPYYMANSCCLPVVLVGLTLFILSFWVHSGIGGRIDPTAIKSLILQQRRCPLAQLESNIRCIEKYKNILRDVHSGAGAGVGQNRDVTEDTHKNSQNLAKN